MSRAPNHRESRGTSRPPPNKDLLEYIHGNDDDFDRFLANLTAKGYGRRHFLITTPDKTGHPWENRIYDSPRSFAINGIKGQTIYLRRGHRYFFTFRQNSNAHALFFTMDPAGGKKGDQTSFAEYEPRSLPGTTPPFGEFKTVSFTIPRSFPKIFYYQDKNHKFLGGLIIVLTDNNSEHRNVESESVADSSTSSSSTDDPQKWDVVSPEIREKIENPGRGRKRSPSPRRGKRSPTRSPSRRSPKRSPPRRSPKRSPPRRSPKRSPPRRSPKRSPPRPSRRSPKRSSPPRRSPPRRSPKRSPPRPSRRSPKRSPSRPSRRSPSRRSPARRYSRPSQPPRPRGPNNRRDNHGPRNNHRRKPSTSSSSSSSSSQPRPEDCYPIDDFDEIYPGAGAGAGFGEGMSDPAW